MYIKSRNCDVFEYATDVNVTAVKYLEFLCLKIALEGSDCVLYFIVNCALGWLFADPGGRAAALLLGSRVRNPLRAWLYVSWVCVCCVDSGLCDELITLTQEYYRLCVCVSNCVWSRNLTLRRPRPDLGCCATEKKKMIFKSKHVARVF
jgi:hypothetical protein